MDSFDLDVVEVSTTLMYFTGDDHSASQRLSGVHQ